MAAKIQIGNRWVGEGEACFIIAEAGSNHNGSLEEAKKLIGQELQLHKSVQDTSRANGAPKEPQSERSSAAHLKGNSIAK